MNKLIITLNSLQNIEKYLDFNNIYRLVIGSKQFGNRIEDNYGVKEIQKATIKVHNVSKEIYVAINKIFHQSEISELEKYMDELMKTEIDGIIFSDFAVYEIVKKKNWKIKLSYNTDTTVTNVYFTKMAKDFKINDLFLAKELTLREIENINEHKQVEVAMFIHGHIYMYNSFRKLISNYFTEKNISHNGGEYYLYDDEREKHYPIIETEKGTNILSAEDQMSLKYLIDILNMKIDYLIIDGFLYKEKDYMYILEIYDKLITLYSELDFTSEESVIFFRQKCEEEAERVKKEVNYKHFSNGFLTKETMF